MQKRLSDYERCQVSRFLYELYLKYGTKLDEDICTSEGWIVYLEGREKYKYAIGDVEYWEYVRINVVKKFKELMHVRNERIRLESRLSLNKTYGESKEEIGTIFFRSSGDFTNPVVMWDFVKRLGKVKEGVLHLLYQGEDDYDIMKRMHMTEEEYYELKLEIRKDFEIWTEY